VNAEMNRTFHEPDNIPLTSVAADIQQKLQRADRRKLWVLGNAVVVILGLTAAVVSLSVTLLLKDTKTFFGVDLKFAVYGLVGLVLLFTAHMIYQHVHLNRIQRALAEQEIQAEVFRRLAMFDPLTGLFNRRFAEERLKTEIARSERQGLSLILVLLDLNDFKQINDNYGHPIGDLVLKEFAQRLNQCTRGSDLAVRWGGDEFMMLLVDCQMSQLSIVLARVEGFSVRVAGKDLPVSFSAGWRAYQHGDRIADLIEGADRKLYANKAHDKRVPQLTPS
jgi:diguanylate cyclase (GGDEF)-like protein